MAGKATRESAASAGPATGVASEPQCPVAEMASLGLRQASRFEQDCEQKVAKTLGI